MEQHKISLHAPVGALALGTFKPTYVMRSSKNFIVILHTFDIRKSVSRGEVYYFVKNDERFNFFKADAEYRLLTPQENIFYVKSTGFTLVELTRGFNHSKIIKDEYSIISVLNRSQIPQKDMIPIEARVTITPAMMTPMNMVRKAFLGSILKR